MVLDSIVEKNSQNGNSSPQSQCHEHVFQVLHFVELCMEDLRSLAQDVDQVQSLVCILSNMYHVIQYNSLRRFSNIETPGYNINPHIRSGRHSLDFIRLCHPYSCILLEIFRVNDQLLLCCKCRRHSTNCRGTTILHKIAHTRTQPGTHIHNQTCLYTI